MEAKPLFRGIKLQARVVPKPANQTMMRCRVTEYAMKRLGQGDATVTFLSSDLTKATTATSPKIFACPLLICSNANLTIQNSPCRQVNTLPNGIRIEDALAVRRDGTEEESADFQECMSSQSSNFMNDVQM